MNKSFFKQKCLDPRSQNFQEPFVLRRITSYFANCYEQCDTRVGIGRTILSDSLIFVPIINVLCNIVFEYSAPP